MRYEYRCVKCEKLLFKLDGYINGTMEQKCTRCKFVNFVVDIVRGNSLPLSVIATDSSAAL